jgi:hypothetical protein
MHIVMLKIIVVMATTMHSVLISELTLALTQQINGDQLFGSGHNCLDVV